MTSQDSSYDDPEVALAFAFAAHFDVTRAERLARMALVTLRAAGYRVVRQEQVGRGGEIVSDTAPVFYAVANLDDADTAGLSGGDILWRDLP